jgi:hypothetical protein
MPSLGSAQDARIAKSMAALRDQTTKLGAPKIDGKNALGGRDASRRTCQSGWKVGVDLEPF